MPPGAEAPPPLAPFTGAGGGPPETSAILERFLAAIAARGLELYPEQEEAILELYEDRSVILCTPTGSGKSLVASAALFRALCRGERGVYTCPIKALVNEKFLALCREFGPDNVGLMTGDASVNPRAPLLCCTAEILANIALHRGPDCDLRAVVMDEFHYYGDAERGVAWQAPLLTLPRAHFLLMSATLGATAFLEEDIARRTAAPCVTVRGDRRPVPLEFDWSETPLAEKLGELLQLKRAPVYVVYFTQRAASEGAQDFMSLAVCTKEEKAALQEALAGARFTSPFGKDLQRWLRHGVGVHHAGLLPRYRILVEQLAQRGLLKIICGTDTLGVGINVPIRTVVFTQLWKYDGKKAAVLSVRDFRQIAGRAGRRGFDDRGFVIAQAPEHVIANKRAEEKAAAEPGRKRSVVKQRAPEGAVGWDARTFERLRTAPCEELQSRFALTHGMLLLMLSRPGDGCRDLQRLIRDCHETPHRKNLLRRRGWQLFRALVERGIVELAARGARIEVTSTALPAATRKVRVNVELQDDFSLHQALSVYLLDTLPRLDPADPAYAFDVLTLCEAIVEDPDAILRRQIDKLKAEKLAELKAEGVDYAERMEKLEQIEHPKPRREFLYETFNAFAAAHPWVEGENVHPKSIVREMCERFLGFNDYVREYGLQRSEGLLLRHLSQVWKVLAQTVPVGAKTEELLELEDHLRELVRGVDSSLLEEWETLLHPDAAAGPKSEAPRPPTDITRDRAAFRRLVRVAVLGVLQDAAAHDWESLAARVHSENPAAEARRAETLFTAFEEARGRIRLDPEGRSTKHTHGLDEAPGRDLEIAQIMVDPEESNDWEARFRVDLAASRSAGRVVLALESVAPIGA